MKFRSEILKYYVMSRKQVALARAGNRIPCCYGDGNLHNHTENRDKKTYPCCLSHFENSVKILLPILHRKPRLPTSETVARRRGRGMTSNEAIQPTNHSGGGEGGSLFPDNRRSSDDKFLTSIIISVIELMETAF
jgi:hypothetical protein